MSASLGAYLLCLEEVLVWLLGAEERLAAMPPIGDSTAILKDQFHDLEVGAETRSTSLDLLHLMEQVP